MFTQTPPKKTRAKQIASNVFYILATIGIIDMFAQAMTRGETRIIVDTLTFLFNL